MSTPVEQIKERLGIAEVVGSYLKLERAGSSLKAKCPFHNERTPSFFVSPGRGSFYCFGCFPPGQLVKTPFGYHEIETLNSKHFVYSGKGRIQKVLAIQHRDYKGALVNIKVQKLAGVVSMTADHLVPVVRPKTRYYKKAKQFYRQTRDYFSRRENETCLDRARLERHADVLTIPAGEINIDDFVFYPIPTAIAPISQIDLSAYLSKSYRKGPRPRNIPYLLPITDGLLKLIGYYVAEGSNHRAYIRFSLGNHEWAFADEIVSLIRDIFGVEARIHYRKSPKTGIEVTACHSFLADIFGNLCGKGADKKHIPFLFQELPYDKQMIIVTAIAKGDGFMFNAHLSTHSYCRIQVVSRVLVEQITDILLRNGIFPSTNIYRARNDATGVHHKETFAVLWSVTAFAQHTLTYTDKGTLYWLLPVREIVKQHYSGPVYNLTVDEDHTYIATNFVVSNCGKGGDIFSFVQEFEGLDFVGALRVLAQRAGVELRRVDPKVRSEHARLYLVLEKAARFFENELAKSSEARAYLETRGLLPETIKSWRVGFARQDWRSLFEHLLKGGCGPEEMEKIGLIKKKEPGSGGDRFYDAFRGRVMFPIFDSASRVIAFSGRVLPSYDDGKTGKYINSPETILFNKSDVLYGIDRAKLEIHKKDAAILVEGQMDLLMAHQAGFANTVASSGTALTERQLARLKRLSENLLVSFDADSAGEKAALRAIHLALGQGFNVRVIALSQKDPAEMIAKDPKAFEKAIAGAKHIIDFLLDAILARASAPREKALAIEKEVLRLVRLLPSPVEQAHFIKVVAEKAGLREDALWKSFGRMSLPSKGAGETERGPKQETRLSFLARRLFGLLFLFEEQKNKELAARLGARLSEILSETGFAKARETLEKEKNFLVTEAELEWGGNAPSEKDITELADNLEEEKVRALLAAAMDKLALSERQGAREETEKHKREAHALSLRLSAFTSSRFAKS